MVKLKIRRIGDELGAVFPPELLKSLHASEGTELCVVQDNGGYRLVSEHGETEILMEAFEDMCQRYSGTLRKLAE